jgi:hypothetical protein
MRHDSAGILVEPLRQGLLPLRMACDWLVILARNDDGLLLPLSLRSNGSPLRSLSAGRRYAGRSRFEDVEKHGDRSFFSKVFFEWTVLNFHLQDTATLF